jgi:hypothetical protein
MKLDPLDRHNDLALTTGNTRIINDGRFKIGYDAKTFTYTLRIEEIQARKLRL